MTYKLHFRKLGKPIWLTYKCGSDIQAHKYGKFFAGKNYKYGWEFIEAVGC